MDTTTKERPIIFRGDGVLGILEDRKTKTRRVIKPQPPVNCREWAGWVISSTSKSEVGDATWTDVPGVLFNKDFHIKCPYGQPGDRLWVRETWGLYNTEPKDGPEKAMIFYKASDGENHELRYQLWRSPIFMPRWASRITLEIESVRVERLQEISTDDCIDEGIEDEFCIVANVPITKDLVADIARDRFRELWDSINAKSGYGWDTNCWVWVIGFKKLETAPRTDVLNY